MARRRAAEQRGVRFQASLQRQARRRAFDPVRLVVSIASLALALLMTYLLFSAALPELFRN
ncbi:MAG: hypothetical protein KDI37_04625 [Xanthomonadales bacterium]|nr:hypothetical protein [Xanthomonadales bacterium]